jgi:hypothetical protein
LVTLAAVLAVNTAAPQLTFAQNQVRRDRFEFKILETEHFDIHYYEEEAAMARMAARMAERWYARLSLVLAHRLRGRQPIILYASRPHFQQTTTVNNMPVGTARGITEAAKRRIILPLAGPLSETDHVIGHELVHAFQFDMTAEQPGLRVGGIPLALRFPLWFMEGMAEYLTSGPADPTTVMWVRDAGMNNRLPTLDQLSRRPAFAFRFGHALWAYIAGRFGDEVIGRIMNAAARSQDAEEGIRSILLVPLDSLMREWQDEVRFAFADLAEAGVTTSVGSTVLSNDNSGPLNLAPSLSPDGSHIVFLSNRNELSLDMFVAETRSGESVKWLAEVTRDTHFEFMHFIGSRGEWAPDGRRFAYGGSGGGASDPTLVVIEPKSGDRIIEREFSGIGEIRNPTWSPDGRHIAFAGLIGGQSDLFIYDVELDSVSRLTDDPFAELHPTWSPDGRAIVYASDQFTSTLATLHYGPFRLASIDPRSGSVTQLPGFAGANHLSPQWSRDGSSVYFVSDRLGVPNLYRLDVTTRRLYQLSNTLTGVAGLTPTSPALTAAREVDLIAFTVYEAGGYRVETIAGADSLVGVPVRVR